MIFWSDILSIFFNLQEAVPWKLYVRSPLLIYSFFTLYFGADLPSVGLVNVFNLLCVSKERERECRLRKERNYRSEYYWHIRASGNFRKSQKRRKNVALLSDMHLNTIRLHGLSRVKAVKCDVTHRLPASTLIPSGLRSAMVGSIIKCRNCTAHSMRPCFMHTIFWDLSLLRSGQILPYLEPSGQSPASHRGRQRFHPNTSLCGIYGKWSDVETWYSPSASASPCQDHPTSALWYFL